VPTVIPFVVLAVVLVLVVFGLVVFGLYVSEWVLLRRVARQLDAERRPVDVDAELIVTYRAAAELLPAELLDAIEHPQLDTGDVDPVSGFRVIRHYLNRRRGTAAVIAETGEQFAATIRLMQGRQ
jgi:hypothetical protein